MPRTSVSLDQRSAACLRYLAAQERRSVSNFVSCLVWDQFKRWTDHWKPEEVEQLLDSLSVAADLKEPDEELPTA
jgi:hypothetical protein